MGGGLSKGMRVDGMPEPVVYENVAYLQRQIDSYMPAAIDIISTQPVMELRDELALQLNPMRVSASRRDAKLVEQRRIEHCDAPPLLLNPMRVSTSQRDAKLVEQRLPRKIDAGAGTKRKCFQRSFQLASSMTRTKMPTGLASKEVEGAYPARVLHCADAMPGLTIERNLSVGSASDVVLSTISQALSVEKAVAVLGDEATSAAIISTSVAVRAGGASKPS